MYEHPAPTAAGKESGQFLDVREEVPVDGLSGLDLDGHEIGAHGPEEIGFHPLRVAEKMQARYSSRVVATLERLDQHHVLEKIPSEGMCRKLGLRLYAAEPGREAHVEKVEPRALREPFADVLEPGWKEKNEIARLEQRQPVASLDTGDARVRPERFQVEELPDTPRAEPDETLEGREIPDLAQLPDVAIQIGLDIVSVGLGRIEA